MNIVYFTHSLASCWNHGNAHFLRGLLRALIRQGHSVAVFEPADSWSRRTLDEDHGDAGFNAYHASYPELHSQQYGPGFDVAAACAAVDLVIVHEWNDPALVAAVGQDRRGSSYTLLFHDTHHRMVSDPAAIRSLDLSGYDGVLAFGEALACAYRRLGWGDRVFVWHEAADVTCFHPPVEPTPRQGLIWIGNWGDGERTAELEAFLMQPARRCGWQLDVFGVRYPPEALAMLERYGARYHGWLPNAHVPDIFGRHVATIHVPRRYYATLLPGIPTIRMFEALACGIPLVSAPWDDCEHLFRPGQDFLFARTPAEMQTHLDALRHDPALRLSLVESGLQTIRDRHTCAHRAVELLDIVERVRGHAPAHRPVAA